jgi:hypothetical protein
MTIKRISVLPPSLVRFTQGDCFTYRMSPAYKQVGNSRRSRKLGASATMHAYIATCAL